jgi:hypothetical protein
MSKSAKRICVIASGMIAAGVILTLCPFFLPFAWKRVDEFLDWPMLLVDWSHATWLPRNAGNRIISLLLINVMGWALSLCVFWGAARLAFQKEGRVSKS